MAPTPPERTRVVVVFDTDTDTDDAIAAMIAQLDATDLVTLVNVRPSPLVAAGATPMLSAAAMTMSEIGWRMYHDACAGGTEEEERIRARTAHHSAALRAAGIGHAVETVVAQGRAGSPRSRRTVDRAVTRIARRFRADRIVRTTKPGVPSRPGADDRTAPTAARLHRSGGSSAPLAS
ncbi:MAG: hypothetical protein R8F63_11350 [Acidimicrobiales bacterium]|nr:hypothetical protein [Acidimicrobiales bacterium]